MSPEKMFWINIGLWSFIGVFYFFYTLSWIVEQCSRLCRRNNEDGERSSSSRVLIGTARRSCSHYSPSYCTMNGCPGTPSNNYTSRYLPSDGATGNNNYMARSNSDSALLGSDGRINGATVPGVQSPRGSEQNTNLRGASAMIPAAGAENRPNVDRAEARNVILIPRLSLAHYSKT